MTRLTLSSLLVAVFFSLQLSAQGVFSKEGQKKSNDALTELKITRFVHGVLQLPESGTSDNLVIFIMGSGDVDRDGNQATSRRDNFKKMGAELAKKGIASFRYDKRVIAMIKQDMNYKTISFDDFIKDANDAVRYFRNDGRFKNIYIAGHSQGSLVGAVAAQNDVDGFISLAGAARPIDAVIVEQLEKQMGMGSIAADAFATLRKEGKVEKYSLGLASIFNQDLQPFMLSWMQYNPTDEIKKLNIPVLIINGDKDLQVPVNDAKMLAENSQQSQLKIFEGMNHVLFTIEGDDLENAKSYSEPWRELSKGLVDTIATFVLDN